MNEFSLPPSFSQPLLAIETSCDETSAAVLEGTAVRSNVVSSQIDLHAQTGGVVPEVAARAHVEAIVPVLEEALQRAGTVWSEIGGLAVTNRPGLLGALSVGVSAAKALASALSVPLVGVHHLEGHVLSPLAHAELPPFPHLCLLVSGGHTELVWVEHVGRYRILGETRDDAAGEAFDKSARLLGLPYPGGAHLSRLASESTPPGRYALPVADLGDDSLEWSFSGFKTAVRQLVEREGNNLNRADAAQAIESAIVAALEGPVARALDSLAPASLTLAGGVAANARLRQRMEQLAKRFGVAYAPAPAELCTDNAAMIGLAGTFRLAAGQSDGFDLDCFATSELAEANW